MFAVFLSEHMDPFYQNIASFPTVFFTFLLVLVVLYWLGAVLGLVQLDVFDFDLPSEIDSDVEPSGVLAGLLLRFGLEGVPVSVVMSIIVLFGWVFSYYSVYFFFGYIPEGLLQGLACIPSALISLYLATLMTAIVIKPLRRLFKDTQAKTAFHLLGKTVVVRTNRVDRNFGEAILEDGGASLIIKVRALDDEEFSQGDRVVLLKYIKEKNIYRVTSEAQFFDASVSSQPS